MTVDSPGALKILVAEDSAADRLILQSMLQRSGHEVVLAEDGESAVTAFSECHPDLVFLDVIMPNVNGIEAARRIKSLAGDELIPVIFLTSLADAESLATCLDAGGDDFLSKPYNQIVLDSKIKAFSRMRCTKPSRIRKIRSRCTTNTSFKNKMLRSRCSIKSPMPVL
jgi:CheY-like chemotaxis protein